MIVEQSAINQQRQFSGSRQFADAWPSGQVYDHRSPSVLEW
jgi:hypothetical protein